MVKIIVLIHIFALLFRGIILLIYQIPTREAILCVDNQGAGDLPRSLVLEMNSTYSLPTLRVLTSGGDKPTMLQEEKAVSVIESPLQNQAPQEAWEESIESEK